MDAFTYRDGEMYAENVPLNAIAQDYGTPTYVYSRAHLEQQFLSYQQALADQDHLEFEDPSLKAAIIRYHFYTSLQSIFLEYILDQ